MSPTSRHLPQGPRETKLAAVTLLLVGTGLVWLSIRYLGTEPRDPGLLGVLAILVGVVGVLAELASAVLFHALYAN